MDSEPGLVSEGVFLWVDLDQEQCQSKIAWIMVNQRNPCICDQSGFISSFKMYHDLSGLLILIMNISKECTLSVHIYMTDVNRNRPMEWCAITRCPYCRVNHIKNSVSLGPCEVLVP